MVVHFVLLAGFTTAIVIVVTLIVQLDYPFRGEISVSAEPFEHFLSELGPLQGAHPSAGAVLWDQSISRHSPETRRL